MKQLEAVDYTVTIPKTAAVAGDAVSVGIDPAQAFNLNGGTVSVSVSDGIDENGKLALTNTDGSGNTVTSALYVQKGEEKKLVTGYPNLTFAEFTQEDHPAVSLFFEEPTETDVPAGTYKGTVTFSIEYTAAEGGTAE